MTPVSIDLDHYMPTRFNLASYLRLFYACIIILLHLPSSLAMGDYIYNMQSGYINHYMHMQESYSLLQKHHIQVNQEDIDRVDTLRYMWQNLRDQVCQVQTLLLEIQPKFKGNLEENLVVFKTEVNHYMDSYRTVSENILYLKCL